MCSRPLLVTAKITQAYIMFRDVLRTQPYYVIRYSSHTHMPFTLDNFDAISDLVVEKSDGST